MTVADQQSTSESIDNLDEQTWAEIFGSIGLPETALEWQEDALCAQTDPEAFFPEKGGSTRDAKKVCAECPVAQQCLDYALDNDERFGIWGGMSERERRKIARERRGEDVD